MMQNRNNLKAQAQILHKLLADGCLVTEQRRVNALCYVRVLSIWCKMWGSQRHFSYKDSVF